MEALRASVKGKKSGRPQEPTNSSPRVQEGGALIGTGTEGRMMRSPSIVPQCFDVDVYVYVVSDDFGKLGHAYRETDEEKGR
jgi:hypothetical protein